MHKIILRLLISNFFAVWFGLSQKMSGKSDDPVRPQASSAQDDNVRSRPVAIESLLQPRVDPPIVERRQGVWQSATVAHLPLAGRVRDNGDWATKAAAAYPFRMNMALAKAIVAAGRARPGRHVPVRPASTT